MNDCTLYSTVSSIIDIFKGAIRITFRRKSHEVSRPADDLELVHQFYYKRTDEIEEGRYRATVLLPSGCFVHPVCPPYSYIQK